MSLSLASNHGFLASRRAKTCGLVQKRLGWVAAGGEGGSATRIFMGLVGGTALASRELGHQIRKSSIVHLQPTFCELHIRRKWGQEYPVAGGDDKIGVTINTSM